MSKKKLRRRIKELEESLEWHQQKIILHNQIFDMQRRTWNEALKKWQEAHEEDDHIFLHPPALEAMLTFLTDHAFAQPGDVETSDTPFDSANG
jgi:hypothetical protein